MRSLSLPHEYNRARRRPLLRASRLHRRQACQQKRGERYANFGCTTHHSRGASTCPNALRISERTITAALLDALQDTFDDPAVIARFTLAFENRLAQHVAQSPDGAGGLERRISEAERRVKNVPKHSHARASANHSSINCERKRRTPVDLKAQRNTTKKRNQLVPIARADRWLREEPVQRARSRHGSRTRSHVATPRADHHGSRNNDGRACRMFAPFNVAGVLTKDPGHPKMQPRPEFIQIAGEELNLRL